MVLQKTLIGSTLLANALWAAGFVKVAGESRGSRQEGPPKASILLVEGQVLNYIGGGERGVKVTLLLAAPDGSSGEPLGSTTTDELGDFRITAEKAYSGEAIIRFEKTGFSILSRPVRLIAGADPPFVDVELTGDHVVMGTVREAHHQRPVPQASLVLRTSLREWSATTGEEGQFRFDGLYPGRAVLIVQAEGFGRHSEEIQVEPDASDVKVLLKPERIARLKLVDDAGNPVAGAVLECYDRERDDYRNTASDAEGMAVVKGIHYDAAGYDLRVTHPEHVSDHDFARRIDFPVDKLESRHELRLTRAGRIRGELVHAKTRKPLSDARIIAGDRIDDFAPQAYSDVEGRFVLRGLAAGKCLVTVYRSGLAPEMAEVEVVAGAERSVTIRMAEGRDIHGTVLDASHKPAAGAIVATRAWRGHDTLTLRAMTDKEGRFVIGDAPLDGFELTARSSDGGEGHVKVTAGKSEVTITLNEARSRVGSDRSKGPAPGTAAPDIALVTLEGKTLRLSELKGKVVLLDFWATWCGPCVAELPDIHKVFEAYGGREDFLLLSVSLDRDENALRRFIADRKMNWHHVFGDAAGVTTAADAFGVYAIPAIFLIDREGKIVAAELRGPAIRDRVGAVLGAGSPR